MKSLVQIKRSELEPYEFPGTAAAVLVIDKKVPQAELEELFGDIECAQRFYPTESGWRIKFLKWQVEEMLAGGDSRISLDDFEIEPRGWDHEHCSFCHAHVHIGELSYTAEHEDGGFYIVCTACAEQCT